MSGIKLPAGKIRYMRGVANSRPLLAGSLFLMATLFSGCESVSEPNPDNGKLCGDGANLFAAFILAEGEYRAQVTEAIKEHCKTCEECRKAFYTPDRWREFE